MHRLIPIALLSLAAAAAAAPAPAAAAPVAGFWVATTGNDANPGTREKPFATLARARDALRTSRTPGGPGTVTIRGGVYRVTETLTLGADDSGTAEAPVVWQAARGEEVRLVGGARLSGFRPVADAAIRERLAPEARDRVVQVDLRACGITDFGGVQPGTRRAEVFFDHRYLTLARYPNDGFVRIAGIPEGAAQARPASDPNRPDRDRYQGPFLYSGDRPDRWAKARDVWVHGYWFHDWSDQFHPVDRFDLEKKELHVRPPYHGYGYKKDQRYYYLNVLEELDAPGEWYLERETGILYLWPPSPVADAEVLFPDLEKPMVVLENAAHVRWRGVTFECSRAGAVQIQGGSDDEIAGCTVRNVGGAAIGIEGGTRHAVRSCDVYEVATTGISVNGGDRKTLARGDHVVENCHVHHFARVEKTYRPAIQIAGVGNRVSRCYLHDAPHMGIGYSGNDHVIEFTEFARVAQETGDVGAIYAAMDWTYTGHVFRHNYFHDIHGPGQLGCFTVYPDLPCGGIHLFGNVFEDVDQVFHTNSGRGMLIENNVFYRCRRGINFSAWGDPAKFRPGGNWRMVERLGEVSYDRPPYSTRYPMLARLAEDFAKGDEHVQERALPKDNVIRRNVSWGESWFLTLRPGMVGLQHVLVEQNVIGDPVVYVGSPAGDGKSATYRNDNQEIREILARSGNVVVPGDPGFVDAPAGDLNLKPDSPAWKLGFQRIPFDEIGLRRDDYRRVLPAATPRLAAAPRLFFGEMALRVDPARRGPRVEIRYTLDGSEPTLRSPVYRRPVRLRESATVKCAAWPVGASDEHRSQTVSATFEAAKLGPEGGVFLSDLPEEEYVGHAPLGLMKDHAYGNLPLRLGGQSYAKGVITHPGEDPAGNVARLTYALEGPLAKATRFTATIGIEDQAPRNQPGMGTCALAVEIRRRGEWRRVFESPVLKAGGQPVAVDVEIAGADRLRLIATDGGDGIGWDHGVWADAKVR